MQGFVILFLEFHATRNVGFFCISQYIVTFLIEQLLLNAWYLDDGALAGPGSAVLRALEVLGAEGKPNGLILNPS